jgi:hypothetical protein
MDDKILALLRKTKVEIAPETFVLIGLSQENYRRLLENPELSPRGTAPFMLLVDKFETTLLLDQVDWLTMRHAARDAKIEGDFRLLTFTVELDWSVIGFLAFVAKILAQADVPVGAISAFSRDHLLIKQNDLPRALKILSQYVEELC